MLEGTPLLDGWVLLGRHEPYLRLEVDDVESQTCGEIIEVYDLRDISRLESI
jgi:hypothetical protein